VSRTIRIVMVSPRYKGNLGFVCRVMANFGFSDLWLVGPRADRDSREAKERAVHAHGILSQARVVETLTEALVGIDVAIGTTARSNPGFARRRAALDPAELLSLLPSEGSVALVLGPEERGLSNEELEGMDLLVTIPCSGSYPSMNLSHAASILLYELSRPGLSRPFERCCPDTSRLLRETLLSLSEMITPRDPEAISQALKTWVARSTLSESEARTVLAFLRQLAQRNRDR